MIAGAPGPPASPAVGLPPYTGRLLRWSFAIGIVPPSSAGPVGRHFVEQRHRSHPLGPRQEVPLLLPGEVPDDPADAVHRLHAAERVSLPNAAERTQPLRAREAELFHERRDHLGSQASSSRCPLELGHHIGPCPPDLLCREPASLQLPHVHRGAFDERLAKAPVQLRAAGRDVGSGAIVR